MLLIECHHYLSTRDRELSILPIHSVNDVTCLIILMVLDSRCSHRKGYGLLYLTPLSTIFQLYRGSKFYW